MSKNKLKRLAIPRTWKIKRKGDKFIVRPKPGAHSMEFSLPLNLVIRDLLKYANTTKEVKYILTNKNVLVDGIRRKDYRIPIGLFDILTIEKENFRIIINKKGKIRSYAIGKEESGLKPCKIIGKSLVKGKTQLNLFDGKNILTDKDTYKCQDTLVISVPKNEIKQHFKLDKGAFIYLMGGKNIGNTGIVESISSNNILYKDPSGKQFETLRKYAFVLGDKKPAIGLSKENE